MFIYQWVLTIDIECDDEMATTVCEESDLTWKTMLYNATIHLAIFGYTFYITILSFANGVYLFSYHPPIMLAGVWYFSCAIWHFFYWNSISFPHQFLICMTEAILSFSNENIFTRRLNHRQRMTFHWVLQTIGTVLITIAFGVIIASKNSRSKDHFTTWHGIFGLIATIGTILAIFGGVIAKYSFPMRQIIRPVTVKVMHSLLGTIVYILMVFTVFLGFYSNWFKKNSSLTGIVVSNVIIFFIIQYVLVQPIQMIYGRIKNIYLRSNLYAEPQ